MDNTDLKSALEKVSEAIDDLQESPVSGPAGTPLDLTGLSPEAQLQAGDLCLSTYRQYDVQVSMSLDGSESDFVRRVSPCLYAVMPVDLTPAGQVPEQCRARWVNMLNDLVAKGIWDKGCLNPGAFIEMPDRTEGRRGYIFTFLFSSRVTGLDVLDPGAQANRLLGFPIFRNLSADVASSWPATPAAPFTSGDRDRMWREFPW